MVVSDPSRRDRLLSAAAAEFHRHGYRAASTDRVLAEVGVSKGSLYYYFPDKRALAIGVVSERVGPEILDRWLPALAGGNPIDALIEVTSRFTQGTPENVVLGCPLMSLATEVTPVKEIRQRVDTVFEQWRAGVAQAFTRGVAQGMVRPDIDCQGEADFFVASLEGAFALAKSAADMTVLRGILDRLVAYLNRLRPDPAHDRAGGHHPATS